MSKVFTWLLNFFLPFSVAGGQSIQGSKCEDDLVATGQYVLVLKQSRDEAEKEIARLKFQVIQLEAKLTEGKKGEEK